MWSVAILVHMMAQVSDLEVGEFVHVIADAHIYDRHIPLVKELIQREAYPAPKLNINTDRKDFYDFTVEDFVLEGYKSGEQIKKIPVAV
jgi:thymidylate synthase